MSRTIVIDPITRLEGHGKISIFLDDAGNVDRAVFQVPELRGFEAFAVGRPAVDMPQITSRICGVCPMAHHVVAAKALDDLYSVEPPPTARAIRELAYNAFMVEDHALHFYFLGGPDFVVGPDAPAAQRNVLGVVAAVGREVAAGVIAVRRRVRDLMARCAGKVIHPVFGLPGGVSKALDPADRPLFIEVAEEAVAFAQRTVALFHAVVLAKPEHLAMVTAEGYQHRTGYLGLVGDNNELAFYDGDLRAVDSEGAELARFSARDYALHLAEHVEDWTYIKFPYLRKLGWKGFVDGPESGVYRVAPLARLNVAESISTPLAAAERERMFDALGGRPAHQTLANHWARVIEILHAAERMLELANDPVLFGKEVRNMALELRGEGVGVVEAPRGTLIHHYRTDDRGIMTECNLVVSTVSNAAAICMSIEKAAASLIHEGRVDDGILNRVEMAFRAYDPCLSCATHSLPGQMPLQLEIRQPDGALALVVERS